MPGSCNQVETNEFDANYSRRAIPEIDSNSLYCQDDAKENANIAICKGSISKGHGVEPERIYALSVTFIIK